MEYVDMTGPQLLAALGRDAMKWATAFQQIVVERGVNIDEGLMVGWFANAIENSDAATSSGGGKRAEAWDAMKALAMTVARASWTPTEVEYRDMMARARAALRLAEEAEKDGSGG